MAYEYLKSLALPAAVESRLRTLGARTPGALLSMVEHSSEKFSRFLGKEQTEHLREALLKLVPEEEREKLKSLPEFKPSLGALTPPSGDSAQNAKARSKRDQLMADIRLLRESEDNSGDKQELLERLEQQLRDVLKFTIMETRQ
jgi:hypothetical protein